MLQVSTVNFRRASAISGRDDINIRAPDALHLAIAEAHSATICTLDMKMYQAADAVGIARLMP